VMWSSRTNGAKRIEVYSGCGLSEICRLRLSARSLRSTLSKT
jgi:hypothetical protein